MHLHDRSMATALTYAGTLPFLAAAAGSTFGVFTATDAAWVAVSYGAVIVAFLSGIHWAYGLHEGHEAPRLMLGSNVTALVAWLALLLDARFAALLLLMLCFIFLWVVDRRLARMGIVTPWFYQLRCRATAIVLMCLLAITGGMA